MTAENAENAELQLAHDGDDRFCKFNF